MTYTSIFDAIDDKATFDIHEIVRNMRQSRNTMVQALVRCCWFLLELMARLQVQYNFIFDVVDHKLQIELEKLHDV